MSSERVVYVLIIICSYWYYIVVPLSHLCLHNTVIYVLCYFDKH